MSFSDSTIASSRSIAALVATDTAESWAGSTGAAGLAVELALGVLGVTPLGCLPARNARFADAREAR